VTLHLEMTRHLVLDPKPDRRGQVTAAAVTEGGRAIALSLNAN
jgi:putative ubiquitin-RnfH superfamily antitoxin RatB of RatAB toxin-antitoxin module